MKHWLAIAVFWVLVSCTVVPLSRQVTHSPLPSPPETTVATQSAPQLAPPANVPTVATAQLVAHLQALVGERYTQRDRDRVRTYLIKRLTEYGWAVTTQAFQGGVNIVAQEAKPNTNNNTLLVVAHYDTVPRSPGADDNATGVVAALEVARLLKARQAETSLAIALFDQEEQGLLGSLAFTANPANLQNLVGVINLEMLGYTCNTPKCQAYPEGLPITPPGDRGDFLGIVGDQEHPYLLQAFQLAHNANLPPILTVPIPFKGILTPDVLRSDHAPFWAKNVGAVMVTDTANFRNPHYHQPSDTFETLDTAFLSQATQLAVNATIVLLDSQGIKANSAPLK